jgi:hypothetical protein
MHQGLPWSCSGLVSSTGADTGGSSHSCSTGSIAAGKSEIQDKCNACGAKSSMPHDHEQPNYLNLHELFTKLPLALLVFL